MGVKGKKYDMGREGGFFNSKLGALREVFF